MFKKILISLMLISFLLVPAAAFACKITKGTDIGVWRTSHQVEDVGKFLSLDSPDSIYKMLAREDHDGVEVLGTLTDEQAAAVTAAIGGDWVGAKQVKFLWINGQGTELTVFVLVMPENLTECE